MVVKMKANKSMILKAYKFAKDFHEGQKDDCGKDYSHTHVMNVGFICERLTTDIEVICAAFLHDTIEDTDCTYEDIVRKFGKRVANLVMELTHEGQKDEYGHYFPRLKSKEAIMIKLIDRASNVSRMDSWTKQRQEHYLKKTKFWKDGSDRQEIVGEKNENRIND